jgi:CheY-like chemotaxis protein
MRVFLPAVETDEMDVREEIAALPRSDGQRILYVDDEKELAGIGKRRLERLGYQVVVMVDPVDALELFRSEGGSFDAVVSDYLMPQMNGLQLATALSRIRPEVPVVLLTGFVDHLPEETIRAAGVDEILQKPATTRDLVEALVRAMTR